MSKPANPGRASNASPLFVHVETLTYEATDHRTIVLVVFGKSGDEAETPRPPFFTGRKEERPKHLALVLTTSPVLGFSAACFMPKASDLFVGAQADLCLGPRVGFI